MSQEITSDVLKGILNDNSIRIPKPQALSDLAGEADLLRHCFDQGSLIAKAAQAKVEKCLEDLLRSLPEVIRTNVDMLEFRRRHNDPTAQMDAQQQYLIRLQQAAQNVMDSGIGWAIFPPIETWHDFAVQMADDFRMVLKAMDHPPETGFTNGGPVARFLVAIIPLISGEKPNGNTVNRFLARERDKGNTTKMPDIRIAHHFYKATEG